VKRRLALVRPVATGLVASAMALATSLAPRAAYAADSSGPAYPAGFSSFQTNCAVCHGPAGAGLPALAPPLLAYPAHYAQSPEGRRQLAITVLFGLFGDIVVGDTHYDFRMPEFARLDDATLAATLNYLVFDLGHAPATVTPIAAQEIAAERTAALDGAAVRQHRKSLTPPGS
jgi:mono/diheme cytochrome c family protein